MNTSVAERTALSCARCVALFGPPPTEPPPRVLCWWERPDDRDLHTKLCFAGYERHRAWRHDELSRYWRDQDTPYDDYREPWEGYPESLHIIIYYRDGRVDERLLRGAEMRRAIDRRDMRPLPGQKRGTP